MNIPQQPNETLRFVSIGWYRDACARPAGIDTLLEYLERLLAILIR